MRERLSSSSSENPRVDECVGLKTGQTLQGSVGQTLQGSFSAVSKPHFASKYAFESFRRDLHNALLCTAQKSHLLYETLLECCQKTTKIFRNPAELRSNIAEFCRI